MESLDQEAVLGVSRDDRRAGVAAFEDSIARVQEKTGLEFASVGRFHRMALVAVIDENRANLAFKELYFSRLSGYGYAGQENAKCWGRFEGRVIEIGGALLGQNACNGHRCLRKIPVDLS